MTDVSAAPGARSEWIDAAKGIGIVAVVAGHVWTSGPLRDAVYSFHMPFFFLISGYLFRAKPAWSFARRQVAEQGLTYVAWLLTIVALDLVVEGAREVRPIFHDWPGDIGRLAFGGSELRGPFTVFWFVPCLLAARVVLNALAGRFPNGASVAWGVMAVVSLILAYVVGGMTDVSPLGLLTVPMAVFLLWVGWVWRGVIWRRWMLVGLVPLSLAGLMLMAPVNMKAGDYGWPLLSIAGAVATSLLLFRAARWPWIGARPFQVLGTASLTIMYLHVAVVHYLTPYCSKGVLFALALVVPLSLHILLASNRVTGRLFLARG